MLFKNKFSVTDTNKEFFNNITRVYAKSNNELIELDLINIFVEKMSSNIEIILSKEFMDGDCIMNGIVVNVTDKELLVSFYGLLMLLKFAKFKSEIKIDDSIYCIINFKYV